MLRPGVLLLCTTLCAACIPGSLDHESAGETMLTGQQFAEAVFEYTLALQHNRSPDLLLCRARAWEGLARFDEAIRDYDAALELDPSSEEGYRARGAARVQLLLMQMAGGGDSLLPGQISVMEILARLDFDRAVTLAPRDPAMLRSRAYGKFVLGDMRGAMEDLDRVLRMGTRDSWTFDLRGRVEQVLGNWDRSVSEFSKAILFSPWDAGVYARRGLGYLNTGRIAEADEDLSRSIRLDSLDGRAWYLRALVRLIRGDIRRACNDACRGAALHDPGADGLVRSFACECP